MMTECDLPTFYDPSEPIAKKKHVCCECSAPILKGEKHFLGRGKWDGVVQSFRQHLACMEACMVIRDDFHDGECIGFGSLKDAFDDLKRDAWYRPADKHKEAWKKLRHLMAVIFARERKARVP